MPWRYISSVPRPQGSMNSWCRGLSGKRTTLSSMLGQYRGPMPSIWPPYRGERWMLSRITCLVASLVQLTWHTALLSKGSSVS